MPGVFGTERLVLERPIQLEEVEDAINSLPSRIFPGTDGISTEFHRRFKSTVAFMLQDVIIHFYAVHKLPSSFSEAHTVLIRKTEDCVQLQRVTLYRLITLFNVDN